MTVGGNVTSVTYLPLEALSKANARHGIFLVRVHKPSKGYYTYTKRAGTGQHTQHKFECLLLGVADGENDANTGIYAMGLAKHEEKSVAAMETKWPEGTVLKLSNVVFEGSIGKENIHTPMPMVICLKRTRVDIMAETEVLMNHVKLGRHAVPPRTIADIDKIRTNKATDVLAYLKTLTSTRACHNGQEVADGILVDDSEKASGNVAVSVAFFGGAKIEFLRQQVGKAVVCMNLKVQVKDGKREIVHWASENVYEAPACVKTQTLTEKAGALQGAAVKMLTTEWEPSFDKKDISGPQHEFCCAGLDFAAECPTATVPEVVQINWCRIEEPEPGADVFAPGGERIWFVTTIKDITGSCQVGIPEKVALDLSRLRTKEDFEFHHEQGTLHFPLFVNVRLTRTTRSPNGSARGAASPGSQSSASSESQRPMFVSMHVEDAKEVAISGDDAPNAAFTAQLDILKECPVHEEALLVASLGEIKPCSMYGFQVCYQGKNGVKEGEPRNGSAVVTLLGSKRNSTLAPFGTGFKVTTHVVDLLADHVGIPTTGTMEVVAYCNQDTIMEFKMDPKRGTDMGIAIALIKQIEETAEGTRCAVIEKMQLYEKGDLESLKKTFGKLRKASRSLVGSSNNALLGKRKAMPVMLGDLPRETKKCRSLQRAPTAESLPSPSTPPASA